MEKQMRKISNFGILSSIFMFMSSCYVYNIYNSLAILYCIISLIIMLVSISLRGRYMRKIMDMVVGGFCLTIITAFLIMDMVYKVPALVTLITLDLFLITLKKTIQNILI